mgnify:CR=1 FL=1
MLKNFFRVALLAVAAVCALASCVDNTADYDALRPTLLGGVYFYSDHDGVDAFDAQIKSEALSKLEGYKEYFINPYKGQSVDSVVTMLRKDWGVTDSVGLKELLENLKSSEGEYKAWDWGRGVYIAWAGLRAGYTTREEVLWHRPSMQTGMLTSMTSSLAVRIGIPKIHMVLQKI